MQEFIVQPRHIMPTPIVLAKLISQVTHEVLGHDTRYCKGGSVDPKLLYRSARLELDGDTTEIVFSAAKDQGERLAALWFGCAFSQVDDTMVGDTLGEIANQVGARILNAMAIAKALVPPHICAGAEAFLAEEVWTHYRMDMDTVAFYFSWQQRG